MEEKNIFIGGQALTPQLSDPLAHLSEDEAETVLSYARGMVNAMTDYKELRMMYACALKEIRTKFEVLDTEFNVRYQRNPISSISTRLKSSTSTIDKLTRKGFPFSLENVEAHIFDMAGIRVVCSYVDDIYHLADSLRAQDDITTVEVKDYIKNPKPNGYRSYHIIVSVPVFFCDRKKAMNVEVQIRTIAMDLWASLEHQLKYKRDIPDQQMVVARLKGCADKLEEVEAEMLELRRHLGSFADTYSEEDAIFDQLSRLERTIE